MTAFPNLLGIHGNRYQPRSRDSPLLRGLGAPGTVGTLGPSSHRCVARVTGVMVGRVQHTNHQVLDVHLVFVQSHVYALDFMCIYEYSYIIYVFMYVYVSVCVSPYIYITDANISMYMFVCIYMYSCFIDLVRYYV
jgi:hypothetical protein